MKKILTILLSAVIIFATFSVCMIPCFAVSLDKDGTYSVPVKMLDPKKDKESMGDRFIEHTAMITVKDGKKTITVLMPKESDLVFCYYVNGGVDGESKEAVKQTNIKFDGNTYPVGYTFPLVKDNDPVGLYFVLSFLGIKPSARLAPDYSKLRAVELAEETTEAEETTAAEDETEAVIEEEISESEEAITEDASVVITEEPESAEVEASSAIIGGADEATDILVSNENSSIPVWVYIAGAVAVIAIIAVITVAVKKKKK